MMSARFSLRFGGAFWALVVAWLCAQSPQAAIVEVMNWAAGAVHISHYDALVTEVERVILSEGESDTAAIVVLQSKADEERGKPVALPITGVVEKLLLALSERERLAGEMGVETTFARADDWVLLGNTAEEPLHPPPRGV